MRQSEGKGAFIISKRCHEVVAYSWPGHFPNWLKHLKLAWIVSPMVQLGQPKATWRRTDLRQFLGRAWSCCSLPMLQLWQKMESCCEEARLETIYIYISISISIALSLSLSPSLSLSTYLSIYIYIYYRYICIYIYTHHTYIYIYTCMNMQHADILHVNSRGLDWDKQKTL